MPDSPSLEIANSSDFGEVREQVHRIVREIAPWHEMAHIDRAFQLVEAGCEGALGGYERLLTPYHDRSHILEVVLCSARLLHGVQLGGRAIDALTIDACLVGALLHDSGYLMRTTEVAGTGAQFTKIHVPRGVVFAETELGHEIPPELMAATGKVILTTDHRPVAFMPEFSNGSEQLAAYITATADLIGQMANREYLERLLLLYFEFREGGIGAFSDVHDLLEKTDGFYKLMVSRLQSELGGLAPHLVRHFDKTRGVRRNFYLESIDRNLDYLARLVREDRSRRIEYLKRGGIVEKAMHLFKEP